MNKIEYIARELAKLDGIADPDTLAVDVRINPWQNQMIRLVDSEAVTSAAWKFYATEAELVLKFAAMWEKDVAATRYGIFAQPVGGTDEPL